MSPTLNLSMIFALSSLLLVETICLLDTQAFPLNLSNFIIANFFMLIVAMATSMYPLIIDFAFDVISKKNKQ